MATLPHAVDIPQLAGLTVGYVGADLVQLVREAERRAAQEALHKVGVGGATCITMDIMAECLTLVQPSLKREVHVDLQGVMTWDDIGVFLSGCGSCWYWNQVGGFRQFWIKKKNAADISLGSVCAGVVWGLGNAWAGLFVRLWQGLSRVWAGIECAGIGF